MDRFAALAGAELGWTHEVHSGQPPLGSLLLWWRLASVGPRHGKAGAGIQEGSVGEPSYLSDVRRRWVEPARLYGRQGAHPRDCQRRRSPANPSRAQLVVFP